MSLMGQTWLSGAMLGSSVKPPKADIRGPAGNVAEVPETDIAVPRTFYASHFRSDWEADSALDRHRRTFSFEAR